MKGSKSDGQVLVGIVERKVFQAFLDTGKTMKIKHVELGRKREPIYRDTDLSILKEFDAGKNIQYLLQGALIQSHDS